MYLRDNVQVVEFILWMDPSIFVAIILTNSNYNLQGYTIRRLGRNKLRERLRAALLIQILIAMIEV